MRWWLSISVLHRLSSLFLVPSNVISLSFYSGFLFLQHHHWIIASEALVKSFWFLEGLLHSTALDNFTDCKSFLSADVAMLVSLERVTHALGSSLMPFR